MRRIVKVLKAIGVFALAVILFAAGFVAFLSITEYKPEDSEVLEIENADSAVKRIEPGKDFTMLTWNIGYGALGDNADFFMDGGKGVNTADKERVMENMQGIIDGIDSIDPDVLFIQEIDRKSTRSKRINEYEMLRDVRADSNAAFATNFKVAFVPYPLPPIGKVDSGIATYSKFATESARRVQLPVPFKWPVSMANLKRGLLISRIPIEENGKELVFYNLHLEAYDSGEGKIEQTRLLTYLLQAEAKNGNYVIAAGDFNQFFSSIDNSAYPLQEHVWKPGEINTDDIEGNWQFVMDNRVPTCRSLDQPYAGADKESFQYYLIDGYIVSDNIEVEEVITHDLGFVHSDHNPVFLKAKLN